MYVDLNPVRAAMAETPEQSLHTSAYDRIKGAEGHEIASAAFDLVPIPTEQAGKEIRETPVGELKKGRKHKMRSPTGRRIRRDAWLAPLTLGRTKSADQPEVHRGGVRASNKGFLSISQQDYLRLLHWTAKQDREGVVHRVPDDLQPTLKRLGIDLAMWRDLVWNFKRYFGQSCCAGSPAGMSRVAESAGKHWSRGQRSVAKCFVS
jgi:hypothetical protein